MYHLISNALIAFMLLIYLHACAPVPVSSHKSELDEYGCTVPPPDTFTSTGLDVRFAQDITKVVTGEINIKTEPKAQTLITTAANDDRMMGYLRCLMIRRDKFKPEQVAYFEQLTRFSRTNPSPDAYQKWMNDNPFPSSDHNDPYNRVTQGLKDLQDGNLEIRIAGIRSLGDIAKQTDRGSDKYYWQIIEAICSYIRQKAAWVPGGRSAVGRDIQEAFLIIAHRRKAFGKGEDIRLDLHKISVPGLKLREANLEKAILWGSDLDGAGLWGANLKGTDLGGTSLNGADLENANLSESLLWVSNDEEPKRPSSLVKTRLTRANLSKATLVGANMAQADLQDADLSHANLINANLAGAHLTGASLEDAKFKFANLEEAVLLGANVNRVDFSGANLKHSMGLTDAQLKSAVLDSDTRMP
jgi:uncharacterized protein YjbI with pentapeptide repeats